jgi:hypothetical protein
VDFVLHNAGAHICDATALRIRAYTNVQRPASQTDVTDKVQTKFRNRLVTPLGPYAELFGEVAPGAEKTLKVKLHYWRDGVVKYLEFPQDAALDLTGRAPPDRGTAPADCVCRRLGRFAGVACSGNRGDPLDRQRIRAADKIDLDLAALGQVDHVLAAGIGQTVPGRCQILARRHGGQSKRSANRRVWPRLCAHGIPRLRRRLAQHAIVVRVHEDRMMAAHEALPNPIGIAADAPQVIRVGKDHLGTVGRRRIGAVIVPAGRIGVGRNPIGRAGEQLAFVPRCFASRE